MKMKKKGSERKTKEKQKSKPQVESTLQSNQTSSGEGKASSKRMRNSLLDNAALSSGLKGAVRRGTRISSGMYDSDRCSNDFAISEQDTAQVVCASKDQESSPVKPAQALNQDVEKIKQIVPMYGKQTEPIVELKEVDNMPKPKRKRRKAKVPSLENTKILPVPQEDNLLELKVELKALDVAPFALQTEELLCAPMEVDLPSDPPTKEKKGRKRKPAEQTSPEKKLRAECELELPVITAEEKPVLFCETSEPFRIAENEQVQNVTKDMPSLTSELEHPQNTRDDEYDLPLNDITRVSCKEEPEHVMPMIGPETLVCHEVDLDDCDEQDKVEDLVTEKAETAAQTKRVPTLPPTVLPQSYSATSPLALSHDESHSIKSESDITIEVDSVAEESQKGKGGSSDSESLSALNTSSKCAPVMRINVPKPQENMRLATTLTSPHRKQTKKDKHREKHQHSSPRAYKWTLQLNELDNMSGTEKIVFLEDTLQEIRKQYMSLKCEVAAIDRRRMELKGRRVYNTRASMSFASSETGMSSSSSTPSPNKAHWL